MSFHNHDYKEKKWRKNEGKKDWSSKKCHSRKKVLEHKHWSYVVLIKQRVISKFSTPWNSVVPCGPVNSKGINSSLSILNKTTTELRSENRGPINNQIKGKLLTFRTNFQQQLFFLAHSSLRSQLLQSKDHRFQVPVH